MCLRNVHNTIRIIPTHTVWYCDSKLWNVSILIKLREESFNDTRFDGFSGINSNLFKTTITRSVSDSSKAVKICSYNQTSAGINYLFSHVLPDRRLVGIGRMNDFDRLLCRCCLLSVCNRVKPSHPRTDVWPPVILIERVDCILKTQK